MSNEVLKNLETETILCILLRLLLASLLENTEEYVIIY